LAFVALLTACGNHSSPSPEASTSDTTSGATTSASATNTAKVESVLDKKTMRDAIDFCKPSMKDGDDLENEGALCLLTWSVSRMSWEDAAPKMPETSVALFKKDPDDERGKRMCVTGPIIEIRKVSKSKVYVGGMFDEAHNVIEFMAIRSTGEITDKSTAKFCGVVTNRYSYSNSGGGTTHATQMLGMFDLPENHMPPSDKKD